MYVHRYFELGKHIHKCTSLAFTRLVTMRRHGVINKKGVCYHVLLVLNPEFNNWKK